VLACRQIESALQRIAELASRYPQLNQLAKFVERNGLKIAATVAKIASEVASGEAMSRVNAETLMKEHKGLTEVNARTATLRRSAPVL
jgi:hypothetical protein